jgi:hypothetical protein
MPFFVLFLTLLISTPCFSQTFNDSIKAHRGSKRCEEIRTKIRTTNDSIAFIGKTYRGKDPDYADFTIRTQQQLLERLNEEWTEAECTQPSPTPEKKARK